MVQDLATLKAVKSYLSITDTSADETLSRLITAATRYLFTSTNRAHVCATTYTEWRDGNGKQQLMLMNWPVQSITSVTVDGNDIPPSPSWPTSAGYWFDPPDDAPPGSPQMLVLRGYEFNRGRRNVRVEYVAGYQDIETITIGDPHVPWSPVGPVLGGTSVTIGGVPAAQVATPAAGQYGVNSDGAYVFAAADAGKSAVLTYVVAPADLSQACVELVAERYKVREHVGMVSKSLGGQETMSFSQADTNAFVRKVINQYSRVVPL